MHNWEGELVWTYDYRSNEYHQHHDIEYMPNGNILLFAWEYHSEEEAIEMGREPTSVNLALWSTRIVEIEPVGTSEANIVWEWHLDKANYGIVADHPELLDINFREIGGGGGPNGLSDWVHANSIDYNPDLDQIIINSRHLSEFWIIDHSTTTEEAAGHTGGNSGNGGDFLYRWGNPAGYQRGNTSDQTLYRAHDVHWITEGLPDAGKVMIFNNGQGRPGGSHSSIDVIELPIESDGSYTLLPDEAYGPSELYWTYEADSPQSFYSSFISGAQRLPNGNTLICEGARGRFFEVDMEGNTHWTYVSPVVFGGPVSQGDTPNGQNSVFILVSTDDIMVSSSINIFPNPTASYLNVNNGDDTEIRVIIVDMTGRVLEERYERDAFFQINMNHYQNGVYFVKIYAENNDLLFVEKIIKM